MVAAIEQARIIHEDFYCHYRYAAARSLAAGGLLLANQHANWGSLESIFLAELVFKKTEVGGRDIVRVTDEQGEDRWLCRDLSHKGRFSDLRRFTFAHRQGVSGEDFLEELVQCSGRDPF